MTKTDPSAGNPIITLWGVPDIDHPIASHPMVRWLCRTYEGSDQSHVQAPSAGPILLPESGTDEELAAYRIGQRIVEHAVDQVALGASMSSLSMFVQNLGYGTTTKTLGTPVLNKAPDDQLASGSDPESCVFSDKAINGPLTVETDLIPITSMAALIRDRVKTELQALSLATFGFYDDDLEDLHAPWDWCSGSGGNWSTMTGDARASTEQLIAASHAIGSGSNQTLDQFITAEVARNASFSPDGSVAWNSGANLSTGSNYGMLRLRAEASNCQHAEAIRAIFRADSFFDDMDFSNYEMVGADNTDFPIFLQASGSADTDHNCDYMIHECHAPVFYPYNNTDGTVNDGFDRFAGTGHQHDEGKTYNRKAYFGAIKRMMSAILQGSASSRPVHPWVRGVETIVASRAPGLTVADLAATIRVMRTYPTVENIILWYNDREPEYPDYDGMYAAIVEVYGP